MRAVKNTERGIEVVHAPEPDGDGARVTVRAATICGSDLHMLKFGPSPVTFGHEFAAVLDDGRRDLEDSAALLASNPEIAKTLVTHRFPLDDAAEAFRVAADRAHGAIKVVLEP